MDNYFQPVKGKLVYARFERLCIWQKRKNICKQQMLVSRYSGFEGGELSSLDVFNLVSEILRDV